MHFPLDACSVMVIVGNGHSNPSLKSGCGCLHFTLC